MKPRWTSTACLFAAVSTALVGCGSRLTSIPPEQAPTATADGISVTVTGINRTAHAVQVSLAIDNRSGQSVVVPRHYRDMTGIVLNDGAIQVSGLRTTAKRTVSPNRYTVLDGERAELEVEFTDPALAATGPLQLHVQAAQADHPISLTVPIPASLPVSH